MRNFVFRSIWPGILLLLASAAHAETVEKGYYIAPPVLPPESADRFLGKVRPSNNSRPAPNTIKPAEQPKSGESSVAKSGSQHKKRVAPPPVAPTSQQ